jgi:hypothetical protein
MSLAAQTPDTVPPILAFPDPALDDSAAYQGYETRVYRDAGGSAVQVYLDRRVGRVVHVWADAWNESLGFTTRDGSGRPAPVTWASSGAVVTAERGTRTLSYRVSVGPGPVTLGLLLLGSMRVERDFHYQSRDTLPLASVAFAEPEIRTLIDHVARLDTAERHRQLQLLRAASVGELRARLVPRITTTSDGTSWVATITQPSFDGQHHLWLTLSGDQGETRVTATGRTLTIQARTSSPGTLAVRVATDAPPLTPLGRDAIFDDQFRGFYARVREDSAHPLRFRRLEREVRGTELLCYREKLLAGLPNFATYFGRDMLMTALLMEPVWAPAMRETVIASALRKLSPAGDVSHEEALGGQAIRENAALYNRLMTAGDSAQARVVLADLARVRENYIMVDDDVQLPVVVARYLTDPRLPPQRKRRFLLAENRVPRLLANLALVARRTDAYARDAVATNLVSFPRAPDGSWISASWRDSGAGYGGGRFALDVNAIWAPHALAAIGIIVDALADMGISPTTTDEPLASYLHDRQRLARAVMTWQGAERHFRVTLPMREARARIAWKLSSLSPTDRAYWEGVMERTSAPDTVTFLALSLDAHGQPIPILNTDPAMLLLLDPLRPERVVELLTPILQRYPWGSVVDGLGPLVANDAYAAPAVWERFRRDAYHSPTVVWGRDVNVLLAGLAERVLDERTGGDVAPLRVALERLDRSVDRSRLRHAELWTYAIDHGRLVPQRYGTSSDVQLWNLTDLAVQFLLTSRQP